MAIEKKTFAFRVGVVADEGWCGERAELFRSAINEAMNAIEGAAADADGLVDFTLRVEVCGTVKGSALSAPLVVSNVREALLRLGTEECEPEFAPVRRRKEAGDGK